MITGKLCNLNLIARVTACLIGVVNLFPCKHYSESQFQSFQATVPLCSLPAYISILSIEILYIVQESAALKCSRK